MCGLQTSLKAITQRRRLRIAYQALYASARARLPSFQEPDLRWWQKSRVSAAGRAELDELARMEVGMKLEEIVHFRYESPCCIAGLLPHILWWRTAMIILLLYKIRREDVAHVSWNWIESGCMFDTTCLIPHVSPAELESHCCTARIYQWVRRQLRTQHYQ